MGIVVPEKTVIEITNQTRTSLIGIKYNNSLRSYDQAITWLISKAGLGDDVVVS